MTALRIDRQLVQEPYRFRQGDFDITMVSDGFISIPAEILVSEPGASMPDGLATHEGLVDYRTNIPLIRTGQDLILVDVGAGEKYQPSDGKLAGNLARAGIDAAAVTKVVFTHAHPDHIWGTLTPDGSLRFPNATYYVGAAEWAFWMDPDYRSRLPEVLHEFARGAQRDLRAIMDRVVLLRPGDEVVTGMTALDTAGHTPGHLSFELAGGDGLIITADAATNEIVSLEHPDWAFGYDTLPDLAIRNRRRLVDRAIADRVRLLGYHWTYPGVGHVERHRGGSRFVPAI